MPDLRSRSTLPEKMDDPQAAEVKVRKAMREIEKINKWLGGNKVVLEALERIQWPAGEVSLMDIGCGGGEVLRRVSRWADTKQYPMRLLGVDLNPVMTRMANERSRDYSGMRFLPMDVFDARLDAETPQIITCNLFAHHFDGDHLVALITRLYSLAASAVIINDPERHWFPYHAISILTKIFRSPQMVQYDAPLSVARSLTRKEWESVLSLAGISRYRMRWRWAWRWEIIIEK